LTILNSFHLMSIRRSSYMHSVLKSILVWG